MGNNISVFILLEIRLPIIISLLIIDFCIVGCNFTICKILCCLNMRFITQIQRKTSICFDEVLARCHSNLIQKLFPDNVSNDFSEFIWTSYLFFLVCQNLQISKFIF